MQGLRAKADEVAIQETIATTLEKSKAIAHTVITDANLGPRQSLSAEDQSAINATATAAAQVIGTSKTFQAAAGPLVALSRKPVADHGDSPAADSDLEKLLETLGAAAWHLKVLVIDEMNRAKVADVFGAPHARNEGSHIQNELSDSATRRVLLPPRESRRKGHAEVLRRREVLPRQEPSHHRDDELDRPWHGQAA